MIRDWEELWQDLKQFILRQGDEMNARLIASNSWEDFKNNQGRLQSMRMVADEIARLEIGEG